MALTDSAEFQKFRSTLADLLSPVNDTRVKAEVIYDGIQESEKVFLLLAAIGAEGMLLEEAELSAILLRRLFAVQFQELYSKLTPEALQQVKTHLLQLILQDIDTNLRKKISDVIAELARNLIDDEGNNHWPEFLVFLFDAVVSEDRTLKEMALHMFAYVPGVFGNQQSRYIDIIHNMLQQSLIDQESLHVRFAAAKALCFFLLVHDKEVIIQKRFSDCLSIFLQLLDWTVMRCDERTDDLFRYLIDLLDKCPQSFRSQIDFLFQLCLKCVSNPNSPDTSRQLAIEVVVTLAESAPATVRKLGSKHIPSFISVLFNMMSDLEDVPDWDFGEDEIDEESDSNNIVAEAALDRLACALGGKTTLPIVLNTLPLMLNSSEWKSRYAGLMTISAVGEGCHKQMFNILTQIVEGVLPFLMDSHSRVRYAACNALGQMATDFAPGFQKKFTEKVVKGLLQLLGDTRSPKVQAHAGAALVNLFEDCPKCILSIYLDEVADKLEFVLNSKLNELVQKGTKLVLEQVVITIASLANSAEEKFIHYYDKFMPMLKYIIQNAQQPQLKVLRGKTIECISLVGLAVGKDRFLNDAGEVMDLLLKSQTDGPLKEDDPELTYMISAWARICRILGKSFEPYLPYVMEPVLKTAAIKPEVALLNADDLKVIENDDDWQFVNLGDKHNFGVRTAGLEEKATACQMLVCYARELKEAFAPYIEETLKIMVPMLKFYFHDGVRSAACEILPHLIQASKIRGENYVQEMWKYILTPFLEALESEAELDVMCEYMGALAQCIENLNTPHCLSNENMIFLINFLNKKLVEHFAKAHARDQERKTEDYDEALEETLEKEDDDDVYILSKISDLVCTLFSTYKEDFFPYFDILLPNFILLIAPDRPWTDRQWALCVFADVIQYGGPSCSRYQQYFLQPIIESLSDESPALRQTASYCLGCLGQFGGTEYAKVCAESIPVLIKMINDPESRSEEDIKATENAISAVGKILMFNNSLIKMDEMLPLFVSWLPIWEDKEEANFVFGFLCSLLETNNPLLLGNENCNLPHIVQIIAESFYREAIKASSDVGKRVITLIRDIQNNQDLFSLCISALSPHQQEALHAALTEP